ncbi:hypothetical protein [Sphingobacterium sp.]|uniref:hypothetical protein n=1 Tax=Sphingobacterium sp. TaxID=341027 RepID=UPI0028965F1C|nr:hypothetical protein [Sphingobacterium sp.]
MERIKNYGKLLLGVATIGGAILTQSFTEEVKTNKFAGEIYVNGSSSGEYEKLASPSDYDPNNCEQTSQENCAWLRTSTPGTVPESFDATTASSLHAAGLIEPMNNDKGVYIR